MNFDDFKRNVALAANGDAPASIATVERALLRKEYVRCAQALSRFTAASLEAPDRGERPIRRPLPSELLPPVA